MPLGDIGRKEKRVLRAVQEAAEAEASAKESTWMDSDKISQAKKERAQLRDAKADAKLAAKAERKQLEAHEEEINSQVRGSKRQAATKVTQAEIYRRQALQASSKALQASTKGASSHSKQKDRGVVPQPKLEENTNRKNSHVEASGLDDSLEAMLALRVGEAAVSKPARMPFAEFERSVIQRLEVERPGMKMSQLQDRAMKLWARSQNGI
mmetsp:Transcript_65282/g.142162  ORF Transcript_65282/g.142162 Transcript_65282/m.142162 type:complete len:210 (-) Transcript_65282:203-832(-)|eukprot:CAMPEP_0170611618 /NCGR_PEP_ID=MMETSP0224-20130122/23281_1 /TAXON_ID=285029 /ORGANISM="Togula jolla, Strain CCCM 725" /LENGTH=209 /DNA_ID=CAMNT_0010937057 /DNA_START=18 /DNA_END=647 /DNA_ORIENTATION=+